MRGLRYPQGQTRLTVHCGALILVALAALGALFYFADWVTENEAHSVLEILRKPTWAEIFKWK